MAGLQPEFLQLTNSNENGSEALSPCRMLNQSLDPIPQVVRSRSWSRPDKPSWMDKAVMRFIVVVLVCLLIYLFMSVQTQRSEIQSLHKEFRKKSDNMTSLLMSSLMTVKEKVVEERRANKDISEKLNSFVKNTHEEIEQKIGKMEVFHDNLAENLVTKLDKSFRNVSNKLDESITNINKTLTVLKSKDFAMENKITKVQLESSGGVSLNAQNLLDNSNALIAVKNETLDRIKDTNQRISAKLAKVDVLTHLVQRQNESLSKSLQNQSESLMAKIDQIMEEVNATLDGTVEDTRHNLRLIMNKINRTLDEIADLKPLLEDVAGIKTSLYDLENRAGINIEEVLQDRVKGFVHDLFENRAKAEHKKKIEEYGYTKVGNFGYFKTMPEAKIFVDAIADCAAIKGHLLDFGGLSQADFDMTLKALKDAGIFAGISRMIALHEPTSVEGNWVWSWSQQPLDPNWSVWNYGEPNNANEEDCVIVCLSNLKLNDVTCNRHGMHFICQMTE